MVLEDFGMVWVCLYVVLKHLLVLLERIWSSLGASSRALGASFSYIFFQFGALAGRLGHRGILGDLYFQKWAPRLDGNTISETCTIKEREARQ